MDSIQTLVQLWLRSHFLSNLGSELKVENLALIKERRELQRTNIPRQNIQKQPLKVQKLYQRIDNIRTGYINKSVNEKEIVTGTFAG